MKNKNQGKPKTTAAVNKEDSLFDDCPICQAMKAAEQRGKDLSIDELRQAFAKAKEKGGIVGGEWFDEK